MCDQVRVTNLGLTNYLAFNILNLAPKIARLTNLVVQEVTINDLIVEEFQTSVARCCWVQFTSCVQAISQQLLSCINMLSIK